MRKLRYSPRPPEDYAIEFMGCPFGYGRHPALAENPPAWNLFWLTFPPVDELLAWPPERPAGEAPVYHPAIDQCVQLLTQQVLKEKPLGHWLEYMYPKMLVAALDDTPRAYLDPYLIRMAKEIRQRAQASTAWLVQGDSVVLVDFVKRRRPVTNDRRSANIVTLFKR